MLNFIKLTLLHLHCYTVITLLLHVFPDKTDCECIVYSLQENMSYSTSKFHI